MPKSKFFRVATEGATTDGRTITRAWIEQMARNYDPKKFGARINMEHLRGIMPDGPFKAYGDVIALKAEPADDGALCLLAQLDPTDELVEMTTRKRQKVYSSIEINPDFANTGEAYLVGLAVTDNPASLGTEMLRFSAQAQTNPLAGRKQDPSNVFSEAVPFELELEAPAASTGTTFNFSMSDADGPTLLGRIATLLKGGKEAAQPAAAPDLAHVNQAVTLLADNQQKMLAHFARLDGHVEQALKPVAAAQAALRGDFDRLVEQLSGSDAGTPRRPATGSQHAVVTDC